MNGFLVQKASFFTLIQDIGRYKYTHLGISPSGVLDEYSAFWANKLLGNSIDTNLLEISFSNVILESTIDITISITGAFCDFFINNKKQNTWENHNIKKGDILKIGKFHSGSRVYFAVKGGFDIKKDLGSNSTSIKEHLGGLTGQKIEDKDFLPVKHSSLQNKRRIELKSLPKYEEELVLRVLPSYQYDSFPKSQQDKFFSINFKITNDFDRMACKLNAEEIKSDLNGIISEGISLGSIQIPKDGQVIILLKDRQTIGGYPKIGSVIPIDCFKIAQAKVGTTIRFEKIDINTAQEKLRSFYSIFF